MLNIEIAMGYPMKPAHIKGAFLTATLLGTIVLAGCQPREMPNEEQAQSEATTAVAESVPLLKVQAIPMTGFHKSVCEKEGCTQFDLQTIKSNVDWIDDYFTDRIRKAEPVAFSEISQAAAEEKDRAKLNQHSVSVRYLGQHYDIATFAMRSYSYSSGAAHGIYHIEYVNFDLKAKKRLALQDILDKGSEQKVLDALYEANTNWLYNRQIEKAQLKLSDNYYYGANGIVFVYPLYELASYAEGMTELRLPYESVSGLIQAKYLPSLAKITN